MSFVDNSIFIWKSTAFLYITDYVLVQFTEDDIYEIYAVDKLKKNRLGLFDAPFGPHNVFYPYRVIKVSSKFLKK